MITPDETSHFLAHLSRNVPTSGVGDTPIFSAMPGRIPFDAEARFERTLHSLKLPIDEHGWQRIWGAFVNIEGKENIVGAVGLSTSRYLPTQKHRAVLGMGIEIPFRSKGLGKVLLEQLIHWSIKQPHLAWIDLGVFSHNYPARRLYESFGFVETGRTEDCFRIDDIRVDDIQMVLDIRQRR